MSPPLHTITRRGCGHRVAVTVELPSSAMPCPAPGCHQGVEAGEQCLDAEVRPAISHPHVLVPVYRARFYRELWRGSERLLPPFRLPLVRLPSEMWGWRVAGAWWARSEARAATSFAPADVRRLLDGTADQPTQCLARVVEFNPHDALVDVLADEALRHALHLK